MARERGRRSFSLSIEAQAVLDRVDNYSGYVDALILQHAHDWTESLARLLEAGWRAEEILTACEVLSGYTMGHWSRGGTYISQELERAQQEGRAFTAREVHAPRRLKLLKQLSDDATIATALAQVVPRISSTEFRLPRRSARSASMIVSESERNG